MNMSARRVVAMAAPLLLRGLLHRFLELGHVADQAGEILACDRQHRRVGDRPNARRALAVVQQRQLTEMPPGSEPAQGLLDSVAYLEDLDLTRGDDIEAAGDV